MKKAIFTLAFALVVVTVGAKYYSYDINKDGMINITDVTFLVNNILGIPNSGEDEQNFVYDVNGDDYVNITDVTCLVNKILGISNPNEEPASYLTCPDDHHPHMIDLGLPSGTLWSCCNIDASYPEGCGGYYAWGETEEKNNYSWKTYLYCEGTQETCQYLGNIAGTEYDVAHVKWGDAWRMPNYDEINELRNECSVETISFNNMVYDKYIGPNGNVIIFPYAGLMWYGSNTDIGVELSYWASDQYPNTPYQAPYLHQKGLMGYRWLFEGLPVRPVYDPSSYFIISEDTVDLFVNSITTVSIEFGSGVYEIQNDQTDIINAELIMADKDDDPNAKDEISIYGIAEGTAQLNVLDKQNNKTITVVVNVKTPTDEDIAETEEYISRVMDYINQLGEFSVELFQSNLLTWLDDQVWVKKVDVEPLSTTIKLINGVIFTISHVNDILFEKGWVGWDLPSYSNVDVSFVDGEDIIKSPNVLYIQGRTMPNYEEQNKSTASLENSLIQETTQKSPVIFNITPAFKSLSFLEMDLRGFDMILLGQTHGHKYRNNICFQIEDQFDRANTLNCGITLAIKQGVVQIHKDEPYIFNIMPYEMSRHGIKNNTIFYGCYCYSYSLEPVLSFTTFFGYKTSEWYQKGSYQMDEFFYNMSLGLTYEKAIEPMMTQDPAVANPYNIEPATNNRHSKQRYFSISTDDVTEYSNTGNPIIKGQINGYKNLKSDIQYYVYAFPKGKELNYEDIIKKGQKIDKSKIKEEDVNGIFNHEFTDFPFTEFPEEYQVVVGFEYGGKTYYGPIKTLMTKGLCPDGNHPHWIDLGLPSGTQWRCCNEGASKPEDFGGYYHFGDVSSAPSLNQIKELVNRCAYTWTTLNGVRGGQFTGPNGGTIFLPAAGYWSGGLLYGVGSYGIYWSSTPFDEDNGLIFSSSYVDWYDYWSDNHNHELSVRPVR